MGEAVVMSGIEELIVYIIVLAVLTAGAVDLIMWVAQSTRYDRLNQQHQPKEKKNHE
jgi:flagellar basal body-associated protein FliL